MPPPGFGPEACGTKGQRLLGSERWTRKALRLALDSAVEGIIQKQLRNVHKLPKGGTFQSSLHLPDTEWKV
ncbi:hypothetical protein CEXT_281801 [Caerostris extrusa]|uniref:Uncharacterized protein n=1 Tax=Caerostris extrusa TaxID=172846 RepID=A0AAV4UYN1_CAEEX|nr:hypothetical protein CEXT_281801 [Caerostris extrusa]